MRTEINRRRVKTASCHTASVDWSSRSDCNVSRTSDTTQDEMMKGQTGRQELGNRQAKEGR